MPEESMNTTHDRPISTTERLITAYGEQEPWKEDHDRAMYCCMIEDNLEWGIVLFEGLSAAAARFQAQSISPGNPVDGIQWSGFEKAYKNWARTAGKFLKAADKLVSEGYVVKRLDDFRLLVAEAECMVDNAELELEIPPIEELERMARPECPRPERYLP
jgi:hypothetical protein